MEINSGDPLSVAFSGHDVLTRLHVPNLPHAVIRGCCDDLLAHVKGTAADTFRVGINAAVRAQSSVERIVLAAQVRVRSGVFGVWGILGDTFAECALTQKSHLAVVIRIMSSLRVSLSLVSSFDLLLDLLFVLFNFIRQAKSFV